MEKLTLFLKILAWINIGFYLLTVYQVHIYNREFRRSKVMPLMGGEPANIKSWATISVVICVVFLIVFW